MNHKRIDMPVRGRTLHTSPRLDRALVQLGKLLTALLVFLAVIGGWLWWEIWSDRRSPLPDSGARQGQCALWFVGSSSIHKWSSLARDMRPWVAHNRGVNGANINYLVGRFGAQDQGVPAPSAIVLYSGENDIANGQSVADTLAGTRRLIALKRRMYGQLPTFLISIKPSPTRWRFRPQQMQVNAALRAMTVRNADLHYVDIVPQMLVNGKPGPWYQADGIHLNASGYARWAGVLRSALSRDLSRPLVHRCGA